MSPPGVMSLNGEVGPCGCPLRLAYGSVDSMIGRLRSAFHDMGRSVDNPAGENVFAGRTLRAVAGGNPVPKQALPLLFSHNELRLVSVAILSVLHRAHRRVHPPSGAGYSSFDSVCCAGWALLGAGRTG
eukprot:502080-Prorocentrum_minimum.AAC.1